jgi:3-methyl-2-oxobutanoate hydroxymethyltransferase
MAPSSKITPLPARVTVPSVRARKSSRLPQCAPLVALTAYDYTFARLVDAGGVDIILVGDSLGMVVQGEATTIPVTLEQMVYHTRCVTRGVTRALVVADMPFLSYQPSLELAIQSAGRLMKEGNAAAVKLEGGTAITSTVDRLVQLDIPVMGHIGLTPQSVHRMGGFRQQGRTHRTDEKFLAGSREQIIDDAKAIESAGAFCVVVEGVPADLAQEITSMLTIPVIGIAAGTGCDGQILVSYDLLGITHDKCPPFVTPLATLGADAIAAVSLFASQVRAVPGAGTKKEVKRSAKKR